MKKKYKSSPNKTIAKVLQEPGRYAFITWLLLLFCSLNFDNIIARNIFIAFTVIWSFVFILMILNRRSDFDINYKFPNWSTVGEKFIVPITIKKKKGFNGVWFFRMLIENNNVKKKDKYLRKMIFNTKSEDWHNRWAFNDNNDYGDNHTAKLALYDIKLTFPNNKNTQEATIEGFSRQRGIVSNIGCSSGKIDPLGWLQHG